jgi:hypothetical protein
MGPLGSGLSLPVVGGVSNDQPRQGVNTEGCSLGFLYLTEETYPKRNTVVLTLPPLNSH